MARYITRSFYSLFQTVSRKCIYIIVLYPDFYTMKRVFNIRKAISALLIAYALVLGVNIVMNYSYYTHGGDWRYSVCFSLAVTTLGTIGGITVVSFAMQQLNWNKRPALTFLLSILIFIVYGILLMVGAMKSMVWLGFHDQPIDNYIENTVYSVLFTLIIGLIMSGREFLRNVQETARDNERMKLAILQSQYDTLKNQVNPHFLFNALNTLVSLIPAQPEKAVAFVEQMSKVMRYSLQHSDDNAIALKEELTVVRAYLYLNGQRFEDKLIAEIDIDEAALHRNILTHSLLMLVENAVKHNGISHGKPLHIHIFSEGDKIVVRNSLQRKSIPEPSTGIGLENIRKRYAYITPVPVTIAEMAETFTVSLPLL